MPNQPEKIRPVNGEINEEFQPEKQYVIRYLTKLLGNHFWWYISLFVAFQSIFSFAPYFIHLIGLTPQLGWDSIYYVSLYRLAYVLSVVIVSWRFGIRKGIIASLILALVISLPSILGLRDRAFWLDIGLVLFGFVVSLVLGRQGTLQRLLFKSTLALQQQAQQLKLEIDERLKSERELRMLSFGAIESLVFALEAKDKYSAGHSRRVASIAVAIGNKMNLSAEDLEDIRCSSLLHDVGKIAVDQIIQNKTSQLTSVEYRHVMIHSRAGAGIVRPIVNSKVVELIEHHHDHYNGGGLHQVVTGEDIPLGARILALADAFDAMTSDRPYRTAMSVAEAIKEIHIFTETQFDPVVVKAFLEIPMTEITSLLE